MGYPAVALPQRDHSVFYAHTIHINGKLIGSIEGFDVRQGRTTVERIREINNKNGPLVVDMVWGGVDVSLEFRRVEIYKNNFFQAMGYELYALEDMNTVIQVTEYQYNPANLGGARKITYQDCVIESISKGIDIGTARIVENMSVQVSTVEGGQVS